MFPLLNFLLLSILQETADNHGDFENMIGVVSTVKARPGLKVIQIVSLLEAHWLYPLPFHEPCSLTNRKEYRQAVGIVMVPMAGTFASCGKNDVHGPSQVRSCVVQNLRQLSRDFLDHSKPK